LAVDFLELVQLAFMQGRARCNAHQLKEFFMKTIVSPRWLVGVALAIGAVAASANAHARSDVYFSIGVQVPGLYVQSVPMYVQPRPRYVPAPVYYAAPAPVYYQRHNNQHGWHGQRWQRRGPYGSYGDFDRDGIVNRHDRDRDGDGVRNRFDRQPNNSWRR